MVRYMVVVVVIRLFSFSLGSPILNTKIVRFSRKSQQDTTPGLCVCVCALLCFSKSIFDYYAATATQPRKCVIPQLS